MTSASRSDRTANIGRADELNIFDGTTLADRLTYGDQTFVGTIRTQGTSGIPNNCLGLGANNVGLWKFSAVGDGLSTVKSVTGVGDTGSPGTSPLNACGPVTIVGGNGTGNPNTLPCLPEAASGTGPAPANAQPWPGGSSVTVADLSCAWKTTTGPEGRDMSGLGFDPTDPNVLWGVKNQSWVFRLVKQNGVWVPDTANDWAAGKQISFRRRCRPADSEGLTVGADGARYITSERDNANNSVALDAVLRFDPTAAGTTLTPTTQWNLTADFPELLVPGKANLGFEGVAFVPDTYLVQHGFIDQSNGAAYDPGDYPVHGSGLYFAALENDGKLYAYVLNTDGSSHRVAVVDTGMVRVMDVQYDPDLERIWALCDNTCSVSSTLLKVDFAGVVVPDSVYAKPAGLPNANIEGFAIAPDSTCVEGTKEVVLVRRRDLGARVRGPRAVQRHVPVRRAGRRPRRRIRDRGEQRHDDARRPRHALPAVEPDRDGRLGDDRFARPARGGGGLRVRFGNRDVRSGRDVGDCLVHRERRHDRRTGSVLRR